MNTIRQNTIPTEQIHGFLKDKNAWENAISMYQGPDPLDHWYNYICWYENHRHGDPENQFRQTLEKCLSIFEHTDYYKQDARMVRLWLKYIDMQPNPLHFYQVLHTRGVGKQVAAFYISWANYYESVNALKEAEAVYNVAFKEKAQSYAELHHAHSKFIYAHSSNTATQPATAVATNPTHIQQQQQQQYQQQPVQHNVQQLNHPNSHEVVQQNSYSQATVQRQQVVTHAHIPNQTPAQPQAQLQQQQQQQTQVIVHHHANAAQINHGYRQQVIYHHQSQPQQVHQPHHSQQIHQHTSLQQQQQQTVYQQRIEVNNYNQAVQPAHHHVQNQHPDHHHQQFHQAQQTTYLQHQLAQPISSSIGVPIEQQLPATNSQNATQTHAQYYQTQQLQQQLRAQTATISSQVSASTSASISAPTPEATTPVPGIKLPKKFSNYSRNSHETWKPALFLEEPEDPLRRCHYRKQQVYPEGANIEYSPEELFARKYCKQLQKEAEEATKNYVQIHGYDSVKANEFEQNPTLQEERVFQQISSYNINEQHTVQQQQQQQPNLYISNSTSFYQLTGQNTENVTYAYPSVADEEEDAEEAEQEEAYQDDEEVDDDEDEYNDDDEEEDNDDDDDINEQQAQQTTTTTTTVVNTLDDLEDQIEASTIRFSMHSDQQGIQNKTIKIKFKKEPTTQKANHNNKSSNNNKSFNGSYSAYTVSLQDAYQTQQRTKHKQQQQIKTNNLDSPDIRRNGHHSFHPYLMSQTSTPKGADASVQRKHNRSKIKKVSKFALPTGSSSNSSSAENATGHNGHNASFQNATFNDNANYSFSSAAALDNSNCSLTSAVDRLNFRDNTFGGVGVGVGGVGVGGGGGNVSKLNSSNIADFSTYQENSYFATQHDVEAKERRLQKALTTIETHFKKPSIDPFNSELCRALLTKLDFPNAVFNSLDTTVCDESPSPSSSSISNLKIVQTPLPKLYSARTLYLPEAGNLQFNIDKEVGRGSYGSVYKATDVNTGTIVALKFQKPPNTWEIYICDQVLKRIKSPEILPGFMDISTAIIAPNASLIATEFSAFGSLLDINNKIRQNTTKVMHESLVMHFSAQICNIIYHLHQQKIIHADIKPDNFLLMRIPSTDSYLPSLRLIDFGCAIDMSLFPDPDKQKFRKVIQTDGFTCIEMQEGRTWSYETDIFCIAGTVHVMLFGEYMQVQKRSGVWDIKQKLPRYLKKHVWTRFFNEILNIKNDKLPNLQEYRDIFDDEADKMDSELQKQIRTLSNILYRR